VSVSFRLPFPKIKLNSKTESERRNKVKRSGAGAITGEREEIEEDDERIIRLLTDFVQSVGKMESNRIHTTIPGKLLLCLRPLRCCFISICASISFVCTQARFCWFWRMAGRLRRSVR